MVRKRENIQWSAVVSTTMPCWCQRSEENYRNYRKATVTPITTHYNQGMQNTVSEHTTRQTLKQMDYSSRRPHRVPLLSAKNRKRMLQFVQAQQNWTIEDWKNIAWSDESRFLLSSDGYFQQDSAPCHKAQIISDWFLKNMTMSSLYSNSLHSH